MTADDRRSGPDRLTHALDGDVAVFLIGMTINKPWRPDRWVPVLAAMGPMLRELYTAKAEAADGTGADPGFLAARTTVVRRHPTPLPGAGRTVGWSELDDVIGDADLVVLALALTPETRGVIDRRRLDAMADHAWLVNVARGPHVVTDDLVAALQAGTIGGAGLDVTDPEPLPDGHPLWTIPNALITPHVGNTPAMAVPLLGARVTENVRRFATDSPLVGPVDPTAGY